LGDEHGIDWSGSFHGDCDLQLEQIDVYYHESIGGKYIPRAILLDLEPGPLDAIRGDHYGGVFRPDRFVFEEQSGAGNNWAKGYYTDGRELCDVILELVRKEVEECEALQGFQLVHSLGGGTGSGLGSLLLEKMHEDYAGHIISTWSLFPSPKVSDVVVEPYNCVLSVPKLIDFAHEVFCIDNDALFDICFNQLELKGTTSFDDLNHLVSMAMSGTTGAFRFPGQHSGSLRRMAVNLVPFPRLHFLACSLSPLTTRHAPSDGMSITQLALQLLDRKNLLASSDPQNGVYFTGSANFRGRINDRFAEQCMTEAQHRNSQYFAEWIPWNVRTSVCDMSTPGARRSAIFTGNTTAFAQVFRRMEGIFNRSYSRRAFVHWYVEEGMEIIQFDEAKSVVLDLIQEYEMYTAKVGDEDEGEDEDEVEVETKDEEADGSADV
jgi:tubulin beta